MHTKPPISPFFLVICKGKVSIENGCSNFVLQNIHMMLEYKLNGSEILVEIPLKPPKDRPGRRLPLFPV